MPRCLSCGYDVSGLNAPVCPECGSDISADESRRARLAHLALTLIVWTVPLWTAASMISLPNEFGGSAFAIRMILGLMFTAAVLLLARVAPSSARVRRLSYAAGLFLAVSLALALALARVGPPGPMQLAYYAPLTASWLVWLAAIAAGGLALVLCADLLIAHRLTRWGRRLRTLAWISALAAIGVPLLAYAANSITNAAMAAEYATWDPNNPPPEPDWWSTAHYLHQALANLIYAAATLLLTAAWTAALITRTLTAPR